MLEYVGIKLYAATKGDFYVANTPTMVNSTYYTDLTSGLDVRQFYKFGVSQTIPEVITGVPKIMDRLLWMLLVIGKIVWARMGWSLL